jgi:hypothetical protein
LHQQLLSLVKPVKLTLNGGECIGGFWQPQIRSGIGQGLARGSQLLLRFSVPRVRLGQQFPGDLKLVGADRRDHMCLTEPVVRWCTAPLFGGLSFGLCAILKSHAQYAAFFA